MLAVLADLFVVLVVHRRSFLLPLLPCFVASSCRCQIPGPLVPDFFSLFLAFCFSFSDRPTDPKSGNTFDSDKGSLRSWRHGVREIKFWRRSGQAARNTQSPSSHSLAASPVASRLRRQDFISRVLTIPLATQAMKRDGLNW